LGSIDAEVITVITIAIVAVAMWFVDTGVVHLPTSPREFRRLARPVKFLSSGE
jgi:hypothetical protein